MPNSALVFFFLFCFFSLNPFRVAAQNQIIIGDTIKGRILDAHLGEPIPFANIYYPNNPSQGTNSDFEGNYELIIKEIPDSLTVSALSFYSQNIVFPNRKIINFRLEPAAYSLATIEVRPTEDMGIKLVRKVLAHKNQNNPQSLAQYQCEIYNKLELDITNISEGFKNLAINRPLKFAFTKIDSTSDEAPFLPAFLIETISDYTYNRQPKKENDQTKASKVSGLKNASISQFLGVMYANINIYDNWVPILTKEFVSPISDAGFNYYNYYLVDSAMIHDKWCYQVQYFPKSKNSNTFKGDFWVHNTTYAIKRINLQLFKNADLNFVETISIVQNFTHWENRIWLPENEFTVVTFDKITKPLLLNGLSKKLKNGAPNIQGKRTTSYQQYNLSPYIKETINQKLSTESLSKPDEYWIEKRHIELTESERMAEHLIDTVQKLKVFETWRTITTLVFTGYVPWKMFDIGNVYSFYTQTSVEGGRLKIGLRTNSRFSKKFLIATYGAYGLKDKRYKYGVNALWLFNKRPRQSLSATIIHDVSQRHQFNIDFSLFSEGVLASNFIRRSFIPLKLLDIRHYNLAYYRENKSGLSLRTTLEHQHTAPYFNFQYQSDKGEIINKFKHSALNFKLRFAYQEKFIAGVFNRVSLNSRFPIISMNYKIGLKGFFDGDFNYQHLSFDFFDRVNFPPFGYLKTNAIIGKLFGQVPWLLLYVPNGNEGVFSNYNGLNLVDNFTFAADRYFRFSIDYHLDGLLMKRIPLIKRLKIRTVTNFRFLWGKMNERNENANALNLRENTTETDWVRLQIPDEKPYMEASVGIENIFQFLRFDAIWKLSYRQPSASKWGIRANMHIKF